MDSNNMKLFAPGTGGNRQTSFFRVADGVMCSVPDMMPIRENEYFKYWHEVSLDNIANEDPKSFVKGIPVFIHNPSMQIIYLKDGRVMSVDYIPLSPTQTTAYLNKNGMIYIFEGLSVKTRIVGVSALLTTGSFLDFRYAECEILDVVTI